MSYGIVCDISVALNTNNNIKRKKSFRDPNINTKYKFQEVWNELKSEFCFPRQSFTKCIGLFMKACRKSIILMESFKE